MIPEGLVAASTITDVIASGADPLDTFNLYPLVFDRETGYAHAGGTSPCMPLSANVQCAPRRPFRLNRHAHGQWLTVTHPAFLPCVGGLD